jgi:hypothetical protein
MNTKFKKMTTEELENVTAGFTLKGRKISVNPKMIDVAAWAVNKYAQAKSFLENILPGNALEKCLNN